MLFQQFIYFYILHLIFSVKVCWRPSDFQFPPPHNPARVSGAALSLFTCFDGSYIFTNQKLTFYNNVDTYLIKKSNNIYHFNLLCHQTLIYFTSLFIYFLVHKYLGLGCVREKWLGDKFDLKFANTWIWGVLWYSKEHFLTKYSSLFDYY